MGRGITNGAGEDSKAGLKGAGVRVRSDRWGNQASGSMEGELTRPDQSLVEEKVDDFLEHV